MRNATERVLCGLVCLLLTAADPLARGAQTAEALSLGGTASLTVAPGSTGSLHVIAPADGFLYLELERDSPTLRLRVIGPDGTPVAASSPIRSQPLQHVLVLTPAAGTYRLEFSLDANLPVPRRATVRLREMRAALPADRHRITADTMVAAAVELQIQGTADARRAAIAKYQEAVTLWQTSGDLRGEADATLRIGNVHATLGDHRAALTAHERALALYDQIGDLKGQADTLSSLGADRRLLGDPVGALETQLRGLDVARRVGNKRDIAFALHNVGAAQFALGRYTETLGFYEQSLALKREINDVPSTGVTLSNMGTTYGRLGETGLALAAHTDALAVRRQSGDRNSEAYALHNLGAAHLAAQHWEPALTNLQAALPLFQTAGDKRGEAQALHTLGAAFYSLGEQDRSLEYYARALGLRRGLGDPVTTSTTLQNIASIDLARQQIAKAETGLQEALTLARRGLDRFGEAAALAWLGQVHLAQGNPAQAVTDTELALQISRDLKDRAGEATALHQLGTIAADRGDAAAARRWLTDALTMRTTARDRRGEADTRYALARLDRAEGQLDRARQSIEEAIGLIAALRADVPTPDLRSSFFADKQPYYDLYIDVLMQLDRAQPNRGHAARALEVTEQARGRRLLETLAAARVDFREGAEAALIAREQALGVEIDAREAARTRLLLSQGDAATLAAVERSLAAAVADLGEVRTRLRTASPRYATIAWPQPVTLNDVQQRVIDAETVLVDYWLGQERSYVWMISTRGVTTATLPPRQAITDAVRTFYTSTIARQSVAPGESAAAYQARVARADAEAQTAAAALARMLIAPVERAGAVKRWLIVPDGALEYLPFGALPAGATAAAGPASTLARAHEIVMLPSASALVALRDTRTVQPPARKTIAILADPVFSLDDDRMTNRPTAGATTGSPDRLDEVLTRSAGDVGLPRLSRLRFSGQEADLIGALAPEDQQFKAIGFSASRATATSAALRDYRIVHFATHALLNSEHPALSGIVLSLVGQDGQPQNGFLRLHEIYNLNLGASLVVLSACQTALGREVRGDGLEGLARGFMHAGAPRVLATLWRVDDRATAEFMERFYRHLLKGGATPAAALQRAQVEMSSQPRWRAPFYWAGFSLQGEWR